MSRQRSPRRASVPTAARRRVASRRPGARLGCIIRALQRWARQAFPLTGPDGEGFAHRPGRGPRPVADGAPAPAPAPILLAAELDLASAHSGIVAAIRGARRARCLPRHGDVRRCGGERSPHGLHLDTGLARSRAPLCSRRGGAPRGGREAARARRDRHRGRRPGADGRGIVLERGRDRAGEPADGRAGRRPRPITGEQPLGVPPVFGAVAAALGLTPGRRRPRGRSPIAWERCPAGGARGGATTSAPGRDHRLFVDPAGGPLALRASGRGVDGRDHRLAGGGLWRISQDHPGLLRPVSNT